MIRKPFLLISMITVLSTTGCVKETYDMKMLSKQMHLTPTMAISAIKGDVSLSDMVKSNDTVVFDQNKFVKLVFKKDSLIDLKMADFYDLNNMVSFSQGYTLGDLSLAPFLTTMGFTLDQISQNFSIAQRNVFVALNGTTSPFPAFPSTNLGERTFTGITNFENAVFRSGFLDISITNNLGTPLNNISVNLFNTTGHTAIGTTLTIPAVSNGQTQTASLDLTDKTITNSIIAAIVLSGSPGNATPGLISLSNNNIQITVRGRDLKVKSGRVILPAQTISTLDDKDTVDFDPGSGVELDKVKITTGNLSYHIKSVTSLAAALTISIPTAIRNGTPVTELININPGSEFDGIISFSNTVIDLASDVTQRFNRLPVSYAIDISSNNTMVNFNSTDNVQLDLKLLSPVFDYAKGYFGQQVETMNPDSLDLGIADILSHITGDFLVTSPTIKLNYSNSFAIPLQITLDATGKRQGDTVGLKLKPVTLAYPVAPANRDISSTFTIDKLNSRLPKLISMPPEEIRFSGSAKMNPAGNDGLRNNYIFGNSRFLGSLEVEVPLEFRFNNLQFTDTVDNFIKDTYGSDNNTVNPVYFDFSWPDISVRFEFLWVDISARNGFPFGISVKMKLYDSLTNTVRSTIDATGLLEPAPVDGNGKANGVTETGTRIEFNSEFFSQVSNTDKIIFQFTLNTTGNGAQDVKIYSDYRIDFKASLVLRPDINLK